MNIKILEEIGLTKGEIKTYLALLRLGSSSTGPLANKSEVSRSKLYSILDKLEKKGLASHIDKNGVIHYQAIEPTKIKDYLKEREEQFKKLEKELEQFLPELLNYYNQSEQFEEVVVYQGFKGLKAAHEHIYLKLKRGEEYYYLGIPAYQPEEQLRYWEKDHIRRAKAGIKCKLLFNKDTSRTVLKNRNNYPLCDARYMPTDIKTPADISIFKDTVTIAIPAKGPITIEIVSQDVADSFKAYFDEFWKRSKSFK